MQLATAPSTLFPVSCMARLLPAAPRAEALRCPGPLSPGAALTGSSYLCVCFICIFLLAKWHERAKMLREVEGEQGGCAGARLCTAPAPAQPGQLELAAICLYIWHLWFGLDSS